MKLLPHISDEDVSIPLGSSGLQLSMQFKPASMQAATGSAGATLELEAKLKPEEATKAKAKNIHDTLEQYFQQAPQLSNEPIHVLAERAADGAAGVKEGVPLFTITCSS